MKRIEFTADGVSFAVYSEVNGDVRMTVDDVSVNTDGVYLSPTVAFVLGKSLIAIAEGEKE